MHHLLIKILDHALQMHHVWIERTSHKSWVGSHQLILMMLMHHLLMVHLLYVHLLILGLYSTATSHS